MTVAEANYMPQVCRVWQGRAKSLSLRGNKAKADQEAYMQGVLAALTAVGAMTNDRAQQIAFLTAVGRLEEFVKAAAGA